MSGLGVAIFVACGLSTQALAATLTLEFEGVVRGVGADLGGEINVDDVISGTLTYDLDALPTISDATSAVYDALVAFDFAIGGFSGSATGGTVEITDDDMAGSSAPLRDGILAIGSGVSGDSANGLDLTDMRFAMSTAVASTTDIWTSTALPGETDLLNLLAVNQNSGSTSWLFYGGRSSADGIVRYEVTSLNVQPIPVPATGLLLATAFAGAVYVGRRRKRSA